ncbi:MAG: hypothetical protein E6K12_06345 [Methanobacteriota archaeon]|nr:MAG: hypothetical protein E6K12_06345 [Euryarchaeota archaeon]
MVAKAIYCGWRLQPPSEKDRGGPFRGRLDRSASAAKTTDLPWFPWLNLHEEHTSTPDPIPHPMARSRRTWRSDPDRFIEICANEAEKAIHMAYADFTRKATAFREKWGTEGMDIDLYVGNCYFYYKPRRDTTTMFCTCEPSDNEPDIIVTAVFEDAG